MYNRQKHRQQIQTKENKQEEASKLVEEKNERLKQLHTEFKDNLNKYANQYKDQIRKNPTFRSQFNELCQNIGIDPMVSKKTLFSDLGFGNFYSELSTKILDICAKKKKQNGGMMKMDDIVHSFRVQYKEVINKDDIKRALKTIEDLGGVSIFKDDYICTVPVEFSGDLSDLMEVAEEYGFTSYKLMAKLKQWNQDRFIQKIEVLQKEGIVWTDKKNPTGEITYYFPSMLNAYFLNFETITKKQQSLF